MPGGGVKVKSVPADTEAAEAKEREDSESDTETVNEQGKVLLFLMELHPKVLAQLVWESNARVIIDFAPAAAGLIKVGWTMHCKVIAGKL